jgi:protein-disulfide isomerase
MKFYSSAFLSIVLASFMFLGLNDMPIEVVTDPVIPEFTYFFEEEVLGDIDVVRIEIFDDLNCPECSDFALNTIPKIKNLDQETDEVSLYLYFIPDVSKEINFTSAMSLKCASDQEKFWGMYEKIHRFKTELAYPSFNQFAKELELDIYVFKQCLKEKVHQKSIEEDLSYAFEKNINIKPTILVNQYRFIGAQPFENIQRIISKILKQKTSIKVLNKAMESKNTYLDLEIIEKSDEEIETEIETDNAIPFIKPSINTLLN